MWKISKTDNKKYPYHLQIQSGEKTDLSFYASQKWPDNEQTIFCVRSESKEDIQVLEVIEEVEIESTRWLENNSKVTLTLGRSQYKKCEFRFVKKSYKNKPGEYEQIFFRSRPDEKPVSSWKVTETNSDKFPYHITISENNKTSLSLLTQDKWPGSSGNIFCLRAEEKPEIETGQVIEESPVVFVKRVGKRLSVLLDRAQRKRCEFLFVRKKYKTKEGDYEQIFFRTQQGINQHRTKGNLSLQPKEAELEVIIDSNERYPWRFGEHNVERKNLSAGDYALMIEHDIHAVVERKTFENMVSDIGRIQVLHQQFNELSTYTHAAVVIEAQYGDFMVAEKIGKYVSVAQMVRALAELSALHPTLPIIYAGNRKEANHWALRFFEAVLKKHNDPTNDAIATAIAKTRTAKSDPVWLKVKKAVLDEMPNEFTFADLRHHLSALTAQQIRPHLHQLRDNELVKVEGKGRATKWIKLANRIAEEPKTEWL